jgi:phosphomannomutase
MREVDAVIGGEGSGGVIFPGIHLARDAAVGAAMVLQSLITSGKKLSEVAEGLPQYAITKQKVSIVDLHPDEIVAHLTAHFSDDEQDRTDGLKILRPEGWIHMWPSHTEPVMRINAEGRDAAGAEALVQEAVKAVEKFMPPEEDSE